MSTHVSESSADSPNPPSPVAVPLAAVPLAEPERRRSERNPHVVEAWISSPTAVDPKERDEVRSVNMSRHGIAFEHHLDLPLGTFHVIDVALGEQRLRTEVRIMYCRSMGDGNFEIGAEFA